MRSSAPTRSSLRGGRSASRRPSRGRCSESGRETWSCSGARGATSKSGWCRSRCRRVTAKTGEGVSVDASDRELQQYLFDLHGYLVIHNVLTPAEVAELNRLIDAQRLPSPRESI